MIRHVLGRKPNPTLTLDQIAKELPMARIVAYVTRVVPWNRWIFRAPAHVATRANTSELLQPTLPIAALSAAAAITEPAQAEGPAEIQIVKPPGCSAGDATVKTEGYLRQLAGGLGGFGVLRLAQSEMNEGADAAEQLKKPQLATDMRRVSDELATIHTKEAAGELAERMAPMVKEAWRLGRVCGLSRKKSDA